MKHKNDFVWFLIRKFNKSGTFYLKKGNIIQLFNERLFVTLPESDSVLKIQIRRRGRISFFFSQIQTKKKLLFSII